MVCLCHGAVPKHVLFLSCTAVPLLSDPLVRDLLLWETIIVKANFYISVLKIPLLRNLPQFRTILYCILGDCSREVWLIDWLRNYHIVKPVMTAPYLPIRDLHGMRNIPSCYSSIWYGQIYLQRETTSFKSPLYGGISVGLSSPISLC